jgi:hypothetical protein
MNKYIAIPLLLIVLLACFIATPAPTIAASAYPVKVFLTPTNAQTFDAVVPVNRVSPTLAVGTFALEALVAGPTQAESQRGLFSQLHVAINGPSNCQGRNLVGGSDFLLTIGNGRATVRFCRDIASGGIGDDARMQTEITDTLKQFPTVQKAVILLKNGNCLGDMSGLNQCLQ